MTDETGMDQTSEVDHLWNLLKQEAYTPQEAAEVLGLHENLILKAAFGGDLKAEIVNGDVIEVTRADLVSWIEWRKNH